MRRWLLEPSWIWEHRQFYLTPHLNEGILWNIWELDSSWNHYNERRQRLQQKCDEYDLQFAYQPIKSKLDHIDDKHVEYNIHLADVTTYLSIANPEVDEDLRTHRQAKVKNQKDMITYYGSAAEKMGLTPDQFGDEIESFEDDAQNYEFSAAQPNPSSKLGPFETVKSEFSGLINDLVVAGHQGLEQQKATILTMLQNYMAKQLAVEPRVRDFVRR